MSEKKLSILGCVPKLLNVLIELAEEAEGFTSFDLLKNMEVFVGEEFIPSEQWKVEVYPCYDGSFPSENTGPYALAVVGTRSKPAVYEYFKQKIGLKKEQFIPLIHPSSVVSVSVEKGNALQVEPLSSITSCTKIGFAVNVKRNCTIGHHCTIGDYVTINPGVVISSGVQIGNNTMIGSGAVIRDGICIGENALIGAGSVVVKDIPANCVAFGNPCRVVKSNA